METEPYTLSATSTVPRQVIFIADPMQSWTFCDAICGAMGTDGEWPFFGADVRVG
jgi:hypothetical protein